MKSLIHTCLLLLLVFLFMPLCIAIPKDESTNLQADEQQKTEGIPQMNWLIGQIHVDLKELSSKHIWLSFYNDKCLTEHSSIHYMPKLKEKEGFSPAATDQLYVGYVPIDIEKRFKYSNAVEEESICHFPSLGSKVYATILIRGKENAELVAAIRHCIIKRCEALQNEIANKPDVGEGK